METKRLRKLFKEYSKKKKLSKLERDILLNSAEEIVTLRGYTNIDNLKSPSNKFKFFYNSSGVLDALVYNKKKNLFTHITYMVGIGDAIITPTGVMFDDIELRKLDIKDLKIGLIN